MDVKNLRIAIKGRITINVNGPNLSCQADYQIRLKITMLVIVNK